MTRGFVPNRKTEMSFPLKGDITGQFDLAIVEDLLISIKKHLPRRGLQDDYIFQSYFRALASVYFFLGGSDFATHLVSRMSGSYTERMIESWLNGRVVPLHGARRQAIDRALEMIEFLRSSRKVGATLEDMILNR